MSDSENPYKAPETVASVSGTSGDLPLPENVRMPLMKSAPWQKFLGIIAYIFAGIMVIIGLLCMLGGSLFSSLFDLAGIGIGLSIFLGFIFIIIGIIYFFPGLYLMRSSKAIKSYRDNESASSLAESCKSLSKFWKYIGILAIIGLSIFALELIIGIFAGIASAF